MTKYNTNVQFDIQAERIQSECASFDIRQDEQFAFGRSSRNCIPLT